MSKTSNFQRVVQKALLTIANKVDPDNPNEAGKADYFDVVSTSLERIADHYEGGGGGGTGGGVLMVIADEPMASPPSWVTDIFDNYLIYETNVTYAQCHGAFVLGLSTPANSGIFYRNRSQMIAEFMDYGFVEELNTYVVYAQAYKYEGGFSQIELQFIANAEDGMLYCAVENPV